MREYFPILMIGGIIGAFTLILLIVFFSVKDKRTMGFERNVPDGEILRRLMVYAKPYWKNFVVVLIVMLISIAYDIISPMMIGHIEETVKDDFKMQYLLSLVAVYAGILVVSMGCTYIQAIILQKTGQKILSSLRMDIFTHIESLSHEQLNNIPVGKLVTRVTNDTNTISMMFTKVLATLIKNFAVILGVLSAMLLLNYVLTLIVLCFVPFVILFTIIFRKFSRKAHRAVTDSRTNLNTDF